MPISLHPSDVYLKISAVLFHDKRRDMHDKRHQFWSVPELHLRFDGKQRKQTKWLPLSACEAMPPT